MTLSSEELKDCCAIAYASPAARWLLGDSFHPGGAALTARLLEPLRVGPGHTVVDVASGPGTSALQLARTTGCTVVGVDLSAESVAAAGAAAAEAGLDGRVRFVRGDAEALPLEDASMDGALCECALCTFPKRQAAAREIARVLRPGAHVSLSDLIAKPERLPPELTGLQAWVACIAGARPLEEVAALLGDAGLEVEETERHDDALAELVDRVEARLRVVGIRLPPIAAARRAVEDGVLGYGVVIASKP